MKTLIVALVIGILAAVGVYLSPAFAQAAITTATCVPHNPYGLNFCPVIDLVNGMLVAICGALTASTPVIAFYIVKWLRNHGIAVSQAGQKVIADRLSTTIQNGLKFATSGVDIGVEKLNIPVSNPTIRTAANYLIAQSPDLLKKAGIDPTTEEGQKAIVRRVTAESMPTPAALAPSVDVNLTSEKPSQVGSNLDKK